MNIITILSKIKYKDWIFTYRKGWDALNEHYIRVTFPTRENKYQTLTFEQSIRFSPQADEHEILKTIMEGVILYIERHEACEVFKYDGRIVFDPHRGGIELTGDKWGRNQFV